ncbi:biotin transporter BioY [Butyrivibrio sp. VCB2006]|uniref:biotin transporter BioY n=1 Tax=Butyrivibrio sp. VCB2006 TaxID=1280679 RepID=UPI000421751D|nr:biotin transporter BioY [Butyrivibrio sp. VCB2006]
MNKSIAQTNTSRKTLDLTYIALGAVLIAICSWISIPATVPFTLQTFAVAFVLLALGGKRGTISIVIYILLGAIGIPVFAQFSSGFGVLLGTTGGYIIGFILMGLVYWAFTQFISRKLWMQVLASVLGLAACYAFGTFWFMEVYSRNSGAIGLSAALAWCVIPFIIPDLIKLILAVVIATRVSFVIK